MDSYKIKKGKHYCNHLIPKIWWGKKKWNVRVCFGSSCWWDTPRDLNDYDLNKLTGVSFGFNNHKNSIRFAWRPDFSEKGTIEIFAYLYDPKSEKHLSVFVTKVKTMEICTGFIECEGDSYLMQLNGANVVMPNLSKDCKLQFMQYPYFGGDNEAPCDMEIYLDLQPI